MSSSPPSSPRRRSCWLRKPASARKRKRSVLLLRQPPLPPLRRPRLLRRARPRLLRHARRHRLRPPACLLARPIMTWLRLLPWLQPAAATLLRRRRRRCRRRCPARRGRRRRLAPARRLPCSPPSPALQRLAPLRWRPSPAALHRLPRPPAALCPRLALLAACRRRRRRQARPASIGRRPACRRPLCPPACSRTALMLRLLPRLPLHRRRRRSRRSPWTRPSRPRLRWRCCARRLAPLPKAEAESKKVEAGVQQLESSAAACKEAVEAEFNALIQKLQARKTAMLAEVDAMKESNTEALRARGEELVSRSAAALEAVETVKEVIAGDKKDMVARKDELEMLLRDAADMSPVQYKVGTELQAAFNSVVRTAVLEDGYGAVWDGERTDIKLRAEGMRSIMETADGMNVSRYLHHWFQNGEDTVEFPEDIVLGVDGTRLLAAYLRVHTGVRTLNLAGHNMGDAGAVALAEAIKDSEVEKLILWNNRIGDIGARAFADVLSTSKTITYLSLSRNRIGNAGADALSEAVKLNPVLQVLGLERNHVGDDGAMSIGDMLSTEPCSLVTLSLADNRITDEGACAVGISLLDNGSVLNIFMMRNQLTAPGFTALSEAKDSRHFDTFML
eukprot:PLAT12502.20.p1 GENE.PLAT12502.20~~PLAT12502.20.p1  ORF type:complete len:619 (+),score=233.03 PLAT12502.20:557-2413(+)